MVAYGGFVKVSNVVVPVGSRPIAERQAVNRRVCGNWIDDLVLNKLKQLRIEPSGLATDAEFMRRVSLDTIATLPSPAEVRAFLRDRTPASAAS